MFRWLALAIFAGTLAVSAYRRAQARRVAGTIPRVEEPAALIATRLAVSLPLFGGVFCYLANPAWMAWSSLSLPAGLRWAGVALGVLVIPGVYWVLTTLGANVSETVLTKASHQLVTNGPYRWVRHPLYTAGILLFASMGLIAANWFILLCTAAAAAGIRAAVIPREEAELTAKFGDQYLRFRERTGTLLPRLRAGRKHVEGRNASPSI